MDTGLTIEFREMKGVVARKRIVDVNGVQHEMQKGTNRLALEPGTYVLKAWMVAPIGNKIGVSRPLNVSIQGEDPVELVYHVVGSTFSKEFRLEIKGREAPPPEPVQAWVWIFVVACGAIPIVALGGAIPAVLGVLGIGGCLGVAKAKGMPVVLKVLICLGITSACWILFALLIAALTGRR